MAEKIKTEEGVGSVGASDIIGEIQKILSPWLDVPIWIPESMSQRLRRQGETLFATRDLPAIAQHTEAYLEEAVQWTTNNYLIVGGHGQPQEFIYYLLRKPIGIFIQKPWLQEEVVGARRLIETFMNFGLEATGLGVLESRDLFLLVDSTSAGTRWSHIPPETEFVNVVWAAGRNAIDEALDFLNPKRLRSDEFFGGVAETGLLPG